jgi:hypothetical protein
MTDIDPQADIELRSADGHVTVKVPLTGAVTGDWFGAIRSWRWLRECPYKPRPVMTGPGLS